MPSCVSYALFQTVTVAVNISVADYHDKINERPDSASAHSQKHRYAGLGMPGVETVNAETSKAEAASPATSRHFPEQSCSVQEHCKLFCRSLDRVNLRQVPEYRNEDNKP